MEELCKDLRALEEEVSEEVVKATIKRQKGELDDLPWMYIMAMDYMRMRIAWIREQYEKGNE